MNPVGVQRFAALLVQREHTAQPSIAFSSLLSAVARGLEYPPPGARWQRYAAGHASENHGCRLAAMRCAKPWCSPERLDFPHT